MMRGLEEVTKRQHSTTCTVAVQLFSSQNVLNIPKEGAAIYQPLNVVWSILCDAIVSQFNVVCTI